MNNERQARTHRMDSKPEQWAINLVDPVYAKTIPVVSPSKLPSPPGFRAAGNRDISTNAKKRGEPKAKGKEIGALQLQKAWQIALQPAKSIPMNFFMSYMSGTSLQIIPIMTALMLLSGPIKSILSVKKAFKPVLGNSDTQGQIMGAMVMYVIFQFALMFIGLQKLNSMGLIPNTQSDWLSWEKHTDYNKGISSFTF